MEPGYVLAVCLACFSSATAEPIADKFARWRVNPSCFAVDHTPGIPPEPGRRERETQQAILVQDR
jgi:hypothetical protein